jgi:hypothetical protein
MTVLLVLLCLLFILIVLRLFSSNGVEGFADKGDLLSTQYGNFLDFYTGFCSNWQKAIISSVASEIPQQPLTSPSQVSPNGSGSGSGSVPDISTEQMNQYIVTLSQQLSQPLPRICITLPTSITTDSLPQIISEIPNDIQPYINALNWMNQQMAKSHSNLGLALQGQPIEPFQDSNSVCNGLSACLANNPDLARQITEQSKKQLEDKLLSAIQPFLSNSELLQAYELNQQLVEKSQDIQNQAQSGELINQVNVPGGNTVATYTIPDGGSNLKQLSQNNPQRYNELKQNYSQLFQVKSLLEQINSAL